MEDDISWNQWLREEISQLFINVLSVFMVGTYQVVSIIVCFSVVVSYLSSNGRPTFSDFETQVLKFPRCRKHLF